jgi:ABC-type transport system involved in multi-copper enzyme maturation permease subunit
MSSRRVLRSRVVLAAVLLAVIGIATFSTPLLALIAASRTDDVEGTRSALRVFLSAVFPTLGFFSQVIAAVIGATVMRRDIAEGTVYGVLSKPVSRGEYVAGSAIGSFGVLVLVSLLFFGAVELVTALVKLPLQWDHVAIMVGNLTVASVMLATALFWSTRTNAWITVLLAVLVVNGMGVVKTGAAIVEGFGHEVPPLVVVALQFPFPEIKALGPLTDRLTQSGASSISMTAVFIHLIDYAVVMIVFAYLSFRRLEFNRVSD